MINAYPIEEVIRGHLGTIKFVKGGYQVIKDDPKRGAGIPARLEKSVEPASSSSLHSHAETGPATPTRRRCGSTSWNACAARNRETLSTPELGAAAFTTVAMGVQSYRKGKVLFWDKEARKPVEADASWAARLEKRSKKHGKPNQVTGWQAGDTGSVLVPPDYQKLAGPWVDGKDPAAG